MKHRLARLYLAASLAALSFPAIAGSGPRAVIELFTSQGCSSCPPADALLRDFAKDASIIAVSLPVTYWDYLGWKDTLAEKAFSKRQRGYAETRGDGQIYTPQVVVNGLRHAVGSDRRGIEAAIDEPSKALKVPLNLKTTQAGVTIELPGGMQGLVGVLWLMPITKSRSVAIGRGENTGRNITYTNVVRSIVKVGEWSGEPMSIDVPHDVATPPGTNGFVVLLQTMRDGRPDVILGAAKGGGL
jgi:hypothetical protein